MQRPLRRNVNSSFVDGVTPACAGTTQQADAPSGRFRDHPRMCGDHTDTRSDINSIGGSPPHVRGPRPPFVYDGSPIGITPACAGTTRIGFNAHPRNKDYPRMCGDHTIRMSAKRMAKGSPPHVRGPHLGNPDGHVHIRITPACAGTTSRWRDSDGIGRDHPRMCGDHEAQCYKALRDEGSPPHVRGPLHLFPVENKVVGITPACAGTTQPVYLLDDGDKDHPRMCGDHWWP